MAEELAAAARGANYVSMINRLVDGGWRCVAGMMACMLTPAGLHAGLAQQLG